MDLPLSVRTKHVPRRGGWWSDHYFGHFVCDGAELLLGGFQRLLAAGLAEHDASDPSITQGLEDRRHHQVICLDRSGVGRTGGSPSNGFLTTHENERRGD